MRSGSDGTPSKRAQGAAKLSGPAGTAAHQVAARPGKPALNLSVLLELQHIVSCIEAAKREIASIRPKEISETYIASATDELDAIVAATEEATGQILDGAEQVMEIAGNVEEPFRTRLETVGTAIFEASNFQDITGQRISKIVKALKHIEERIESLVSVLDSEAPDQAPTTSEDPAPSDAPIEDEQLLNGPQLPEAAIDQDEIDRLLSGSD